MIHETSQGVTAAFSCLFSFWIISYLTPAFFYHLLSSGLVWLSVDETLRPPGKCWKRSHTERRGQSGVWSFCTTAVLRKLSCHSERLPPFYSFGSFASRIIYSVNSDRKKSDARQHLSVLIFATQTFSDAAHFIVVETKSSPKPCIFLHECQISLFHHCSHIDERFSACDVTASMPTSETESVNVANQNRGEDKSLCCGPLWWVWHVCILLFVIFINLSWRKRALWSFGQ